MRKRSLLSPPCLILALAASGCAPEVVGTWSSMVTSVGTAGPTPAGLATTYTLSVEVRASGDACRVVTTAEGLGRFESAKDSPCDDESYEASYGGNAFASDILALRELFVRQHGIKPADLTVELRGPVKSLSGASSIYEWTQRYQGVATRE